jgi:hypothetical protein
MPGFTLWVPMKINGAAITTSLVTFTPDLRVTPQTCDAHAYGGIGMSGQIERWSMGISTEQSPTGDDGAERGRYGG